MSDTKKEKIKNKIKRQYRKVLKEEQLYRNKLMKRGLEFSEAYWLADRKFDKQNPYRHYRPEDRKYVEMDYGRNPSWFNNLFITRPYRVNERNNLAKVTIDMDDDSDLDFWLARKPMDYYW